jgi:hypothetical protein
MLSSVRRRRLTRRSRMDNPIVEVKVSVEMVVNVGVNCSVETTLMQVEKRATEEAKQLISGVLLGNSHIVDKDRIGIVGVKIHNVTIREK